MKWITFLLGILVLLTGCQQSIEKSDEGETWEVELRAEQPTEDQETVIYTFHYIPDNPEEVEEINYATDLGTEVEGASLEGNTMFTDEVSCSGCWTTLEETTNEITISWTTVQGEEYEESFALD